MVSTKLLVLRFIRDYIGEWGQGPSQGEIANGCNLTRTSVRNALRTLEREKLILRKPGVQRGIALPSQRAAALRVLEELGWHVNPQQEAPRPPDADQDLPLLPPIVLDYPEAGSTPASAGASGDGNGDGSEGRGA